MQCEYSAKMPTSSTSKCTEKISLRAVDVFRSKNIGEATKLNPFFLDDVKK